MWLPPPDSLFSRWSFSTKTSPDCQRGPGEEISWEAEEGETSRWATNIDFVIHSFKRAWNQYSFIISYLTAAEPGEELLQQTAQGRQRGSSGLDQWPPSAYSYSKNTNVEQQVKSRNQRLKAVEANTYLNDSLKPRSTTTSGYASIFYRNNCYVCTHMMTR